MGYKVKKSITLGHDFEGKPIRKYFYGKTKKEVAEKIDKFKLEQATGHKEDYNDILFEAWADQWLNIYKEDTVSESTYYSYKLCIDHLNDYFGDYLIRVIRAADVQKFFKNKAHLSQSMVNKLRITMNAIFETAIENDYIVKNPMANIKPPKGKKAPAKRSYTEKEYETVLEFAKNHPEGLGPYIILKTGLRKGELVGLNPVLDFDFEKRRLTVNRVIVDNTGRLTVKEEGKSKNANRIIPFDQDFFDLLIDNPRLAKDDFLFKTKHDRVMGPRIWTAYHFNYFMDDLEKEYPEIPRLTPHELRHTYGTILFKSGTDVFTLQKLLGHASIETTTKIYVHDDIDDLEKNICWKRENIKDSEQ
ncbi:tyrosine-type recombinase/integrase [Acetobacterium wieringae]|uniref:tyrosine-type recombinase/integrase n=1 Tax=Acetobacterium wieringae TaxID=52694 RepID=UPI0020333108|nr:site-specific integrase [Acetobacterium wieringae]URN85190.1 site-specific integrase [Acetobacterium wieringae]